MSRYRPPRPKSSPYITPEGAANIRSEIRQLWKVERPEITQVVHEAAKNGHLQICQILKDTYNVLGKELKIYAMAALIEKVADNGHFDLIAWIYDNNMTDE